MNEKDCTDAAMAGLLAQARKQFGNAIKGFWFYDGDVLSRLRLSDRRHSTQGPGRALAQHLHLSPAAC